MKRKCLRCWFCRKIIREDMRRCGVAGIKIPIGPPRPYGENSILHSIIPQPIHRRCFKLIVAAIKEACKKAR